MRNPFKTREVVETETETIQGSAKQRRVRLDVIRINPWSALKMGFLLSFAGGVMFIAAMAGVWYVLDDMQLFVKVNELITSVTGDPSFFNVLEFVEFDRVIAMSTMLGVIGIVLGTVLWTLAALLYNVAAMVVGGLRLTLTDD